MKLRRDFHKIINGVMTNPVFKQTGIYVTDNSGSIFLNTSVTNQVAQWENDHLSGVLYLFVNWIHSTFIISSWNLLFQYNVVGVQNILVGNTRYILIMH